MDKKITGLSNLLDNQFNHKITGSNNTNILMDRRANEWIQLAKEHPNPRSLLCSIWYEGEVVILFSNTGIGKSILGIQIADGISKAKDLSNVEIGKRAGVSELSICRIINIK